METMNDTPTNSEALPRTPCSASCDTPITARATRIVQIWDAPSARHVNMEYVFVHTAKQLEHDLTEAREIIAAALRALPVGYLPAHTPESIPARIEDLCQTIVDADRELTEAREQLAIAKQAQRQLCDNCGGCGMLPGTEPNDDVMNTPCPKCNP
jgi:hypothetical protein